MSYRILSTAETMDVLRTGLSGQYPFFYSRFGDAEIPIILGGDCPVQQHGCPELAQELEALWDAGMVAGSYLRNASIGHENEPNMSPGLFETPNRGPHDLAMYDWVAQKCAGKSGESWHRELLNAVALHYYAVFKPEELGEFLRVFVRTAGTVGFVGSARPDVAEKLLGPLADYIQLAPHDAYRYLDLQWPRVQSMASRCDLLILAAGVCANVVNWRLFSEGARVKSLDVGSLIDLADPGALVPTKQRTWLRSITPEHVRKICGSTK